MVRTFFADTSFFIALMMPDDPYHVQAQAWQRYFLVQKIAIVTTEAVLWELLNGLAKPATRLAAATVYERLHRQSQVTIVRCDPEVSTQALALYKSRPDKAWGIVDCMSFVVMEQMQIRDSLSADHHFEQAGFTTLLPQNPPGA